MQRWNTKAVAAWATKMLPKMIFQGHQNKMSSKRWELFSQTVCPVASSTCFHGNKVSGNGNRSPYVDIFHTHYCAYTLFHFLTFTFFLSLSQKHLSLSHISLFPLPFSPCLSHTQTLILSLCAHLSVCPPQCKRLVSRQVLRPIKLSTSLVNSKDTNTQSAHVQRTHKLTQAHPCMSNDDDTNTHSDFTPTRTPAVRQAVVHTLLKGSTPSRQTVSHRDYKCSWQWWHRNSLI